MGRQIDIDDLGVADDEVRIEQEVRIGSAFFAIVMLVIIFAIVLLGMAFFVIVVVAFLFGVAPFVIIVVAFFLGVTIFVNVVAFLFGVALFVIGVALLTIFVIVLALFLSMTMMVFETIDEFIGFGPLRRPVVLSRSLPADWPEPVSLSTHPDPSRLRR